MRKERNSVERKVLFNEVYEGEGARYSCEGGAISWKESSPKKKLVGYSVTVNEL